MLSSITPLGERGRRMSWRVTATAYVTGSTAGGALSGAVAGLLGAVITTVGLDAVGLHLGMVGVLVAAGVLLAATALADARGVHLPPVRRQVDEDWLPRYRGWVYGGGFGLQLGLGVVTIVPSASIYAALGLAVLTGAPLPGALVGAAFGLTRALPLLGLRRVTTAQRLGRAFVLVGAWSRPARRWAVGAQAGLALLALVSGGLVSVGILSTGAA